MERVILEKIDYDLVTPRRLVNKIAMWRRYYPEEQFIFLDGDTDSICMDRSTFSLKEREPTLREGVKE